MDGDYRDPRSGYNRRSVSSCGGCLFIVLLLPYVLWLIGLGTEASVLIFLTLAVLAVVWSIWARMSVKCPRCGRPLGYSPVAPPLLAPKVCHGCGLEFDQLPD